MANDNGLGEWAAEVVARFDTELARNMVQVAQELEPPAPRTVEVLIISPTTTWRGKTLTYIDLDDPLSVGNYVRVPIGHREYHGVVAEIPGLYSGRNMKRVLARAHAFDLPTLREWHTNTELVAPLVKADFNV